MKMFNDYKVLHALLLGEGPHTAANPLVGTFGIDKGLIVQAGVYFPAGCVGRVFAKVFFQEHQILPRNQEQWCHGENSWWDSDMYFPVDAAPLTIKVVAYQESSTGANLYYDHTITAAVEVVPFEMAPMWKKLTGTLTEIAELLGVSVT